MFILSLEVLNISGNNLDSLEELSCLERLQDLTASNNCLNNLRELIQLLSIWKNVKRLDTSRNPFCVKARYRERLIVSSTTLGPKQIFELIKQIRSFFTLSIEIYLLEPLYLVKAIAIQVYLSNACRHRESESIAQL